MNVIYWRMLNCCAKLRRQLCWILTVQSDRPESIFFDCSSPRAISIGWLMCPPGAERTMQSRHKASGARGLSGQFSVVMIALKMSSPRIYSAAQEVPRSECQDVPSEVPKQVEKNVCKDIPRQVRPVNQSIRSTASYLIREGVHFKHSTGKKLW